MASSQIQIVSDSTTESEPVVADPPQNTTDSVFSASACGDLEKLRKLVEQDGAYLSSRDNDGCYALHEAADNNHPEIVQYIIEHGGDVNAVNNSQQTSLHFAANSGLILVADVLLQNGAQVEVADVDGSRAVHIAAQNGHTSFLKHIVAKYNADLDVPANDGQRPLHVAVSGNHPKTALYIIEHGGDVNAVDNSQMTALHWAADEGSISVADVLLQNGAHVEAATVSGGTVVHFAAQNGHTSFLKHIVAKYNVDFDVPNTEGMSPLHYAAIAGFVDTVKWLLSKDASQKRQDENGRTPLHWAALCEKMEVCTCLIDAGTKQDIMVKDNEGNTPIQLIPVDSRENRAIFLVCARASKTLQAECKHLQNLNNKGKALNNKGKALNNKGKALQKENWPMIIAMQGDAYTGKSFLANKLASNLKCPLICLDDFLDASEPTDEKDTLILNAFNVITHIVGTQIALGFSVVVDSPLSRLSDLQKLIALVSGKNPKNTRLLIIECKPENEYAYQLKFEEKGSEIYSRLWYKPKKAWPLPKVPKDYTDDDIPNEVSKLVFDTHDATSACHLLTVIFDITSCGYGHKANYDEYWEFIHTDKEEQFTCPCRRCCNRKTFNSNLDLTAHQFTFYKGIDHCDKLCGVCDNQVYGPCYTCKDCPLILHKSCAELARGEKKHFVPESFPMFLPSGPNLRYTFPIERPCAECGKDGNGFSYKCKHCLFESHLKSRLVPTVVRHKVNDIFLTLWLNSDVDGSTVHYMCLACRKTGDFAVYLYGTNHVYHPKCALLPPSVHHSHGGYTHDLEMITKRVEKEEDYICDCCSIKMDPTAWYYYCSECKISLHMECAFLDFDTGEPITEARS